MLLRIFFLIAIVISGIVACYYQDKTIKSLNRINELIK